MRPGRTSAHIGCTAVDVDVAVSVTTQSTAPELILIDLPEAGEGTCTENTSPVAALRVGPAADLIAGTGDFVWISDCENALLTQVDLRTMCVGITLSVGSSRH